MAEEKLASMKAQVYKDPRPKETFDHAHARVRRAAPGPVYEVVRMLTSLYAWTFFRLSSHQSWKVPVAGPVILAPNHFSFMDHFFVGAGIRRRVQFMAKSQMFKGFMQRGDLHPRRRVPGPPRRAGRGVLHHRSRDPRARRADRHVLRGRALAHRRH